MGQEHWLPLTGVPGLKQERESEALQRDECMTQYLRLELKTRTRVKYEDNRLGWTEWVPISISRGSIEDIYEAHVYCLNKLEKKARAWEATNVRKKNRFPEGAPEQKYGAVLS